MQHFIQLANSRPVQLDSTFHFPGSVRSCLLIGAIHLHNSIIANCQVMCIWVDRVSMLLFHYHLAVGHLCHENVTECLHRWEIVTTNIGF